MLIKSCVDGKFYPENPEVLRQMILEMLSEAQDKKDLPLPKAIIAPHAGYIYSGPIAASAYANLSHAKKKIKRVVVLAPAHHYPIDGIATTSADTYTTPLGKIKIDQETISKLKVPYLYTIDEVFNHEHALEVHLPFLQIILGDFDLVPFLVGHADTDNVADLIENLWGGPETFFVISSDLSHHHPYSAAESLDQNTAKEIVNLNPEGFTYENACGARGIKGLLKVAAKKEMKTKLVDLRNSGDTAGSKDSVVGYGAFHFIE